MFGLNFFENGLDLTELISSGLPPTKRDRSLVVEVNPVEDDQDP